ncbi:hypothetical protein PC116_g15799 [Phytophthora cactorum]|uniref:Uncharacterized protein n=2 Tax=Phytophthora cactorum TaxID=29920 RepID=A0A8T1KHA4_9STRA|nr:hypothetical protein PC114_g22665 [Phytophthora cactorum]KAG2916158.1 hypothetical protein PC117_g17820 [Phytophthora cactorum]KAG4236109.1 hypothetical protein PC116_g15799 [Phytophthora cactorum]
MYDMHGKAAVSLAEPRVHNKPSSLYLLSDGGRSAPERERGEDHQAHPKASQGHANYQAVPTSFSDPRCVPADSSTPGRVHEPPETRPTVAVQDHTQHATNMEMPTVLTPYQRMRELLSVKGLGRAAGPRVDDLQTYLRSDRSARIIIRLRLLWGSDHGHNNWKMVFKTPCEANREDIDSILVTVTVWNMESKSDLLPTPCAN